MDKSKKEIVFSILEGLNSYNISDDSVFDEEHIGYQVDIARIALIKDEIKEGKLSDQYYQPTCCIEIQCEQDGCEVVGMGTIKTGIITYYAELPGLIAFYDTHNIKYLGGQGWDDNWYRVPFSTFVSGVVGQWSQGKTIYTIINGKVLFKNLPTAGVKFFCLLGLFETPETVCDYDAEKPYPVSDPLKIEIIVVKNILSRLGINYSERNDANPNIAQQQKK